MFASFRLKPASRRSLFAAIAVLLVFTGSNGYAQKTTAFPHSTPEAEGVSAAGIDSFLTALGQSKHEFHSIMILRHGKVVAEGWWKPYAPQLRHSLYSASKSFTSTAVGFAVSEGKLSVNDKVISFFPHSLPDTVKPYLAELTVKDLLTMSVGMATDPTSTIPFKSDDWVRTFLATPIANKPGSKFLYNSMATFMLSAIVQQVTGQKVLDYLKPRLFDPLGIKGEDWEASGKGINTGGWGLRLKTEDMAKLGMLYLHKGMWNGKQLLPEAWVNEATTFKIDQAPDAPQSKKDSSDWMQGYCYQFWRCRHNAFRADGAFGQYIIVMPDQDAVIAIQSESPNMQGELDLVWQYLLPAMRKLPIAIGTMPTQTTVDDALAQHLKELSLPPVAGAATSANTSFNQVSFQPNKDGYKSLHLSFDGGTCHATLQVGDQTYNIQFGNGKWIAGETNWLGPYLLYGDTEDFSILKPSKIDAGYAFTDANTLQLKVRYIESPHSRIITLHLDGKNVTGTVENSFSYGQNKLQLVGTAE